jgi:arginine utilization protein RocB
MKEALKKRRINDERTVEMSKKLDTERLKKDILRIMYDYVSEDTITDSENELKVADFFKRSVLTLPCLKDKPQFAGLYNIPGDFRGRCVPWAMVKGKGRKTVVLMHHYDVVPIEDFKIYKPYAFKPDELRKMFERDADEFSEAIRKDIRSGEWTFGRGTCDMKGGGAIQYSLLAQYGEDPDFEGNVIVIAVPDEENLSAGMRGAVHLLKDLKEKHDLEYVCMIDSESHQRKDPSKFTVYLGSIGKLMPFVCVRGFLAHAGKSYEGINPISVMSDVVRLTENNMDLADAMDGESAPGPTWLYLKDSKTSYDVSMPLSVYGCLNVLTLTQTPGELMAKIRTICEQAFSDAIARTNKAYRTFMRNTGKEEKDQRWKVRVVSLGELRSELIAKDPDFGRKYREYSEKLADELLAGSISIIDYNRILVNYMIDNKDDIEPLLVYGIVPPYYPSVISDEFGEKGGLVDELNAFSKESFGLEITSENYYTGISDLSYGQLENAAAIRQIMEDCCPLFGTEIYDIPLEEIEEISMPVINIGPWGEDLHKFSESVNTEDLLVHAPAILDRAIRSLLAE